MALFDLVKSKVKDEAGQLSDPDDYTGAVAEALKRYSRHRQRLVCEDLPGTGSADLALPTGWVDGLSAIISVEYPIGQVPESLLDTDQWRLYQTPTTTVLRLLDALPGSGDTVRVLYNALHTEQTLPTADQEAVASLAAAICLRQLAALHGQSGDPTINADVVNYQSKTDAYRRLADTLEEQYTDHLGLGGNTPLAAAMAVAKPQNSGRGRLTH